MIPRDITGLLKMRLANYPAVALIGPRQCGKTTLARSVGGSYFDLEHEPDRLRLDLEWDLLASGSPLVILDEAQAWPEVFPRLRSTIDRDRDRKGRFLLLGSVSPALMKHVSESLAGRLSLVELTPFLWNELPSAAARRRLWLCGGYPEGGVLQPARYPQWQSDYLTLLTDRDLPTWGLPARPQMIRRMLKMLAVLQGETWNASRLAESLGISFHTVNSYLDFLAGAFLVRRLPPYFTNLGKRLVKSPKVYWRDTGLLHALLNINSKAGLLAHPSVGVSWEGFGIEQVIGALAQKGRMFEPYFLRTSDGYEIDLVIDFGRSRWAIEFKLTSSPSPSDMERLDRTADWIDAGLRILVSHVREPVKTDRHISCDLPWLLGHLPGLLRRIPA